MKNEKHEKFGSGDFREKKLFHFQLKVGNKWRLLENEMKPKLIGRLLTAPTARSRPILKRVRHLFLSVRVMHSVGGRTSTRSSERMIGSVSVGQVVRTHSAGVPFPRALIPAEVVMTMGSRHLAFTRPLTRRKLANAASLRSVRLYLSMRILYSSTTVCTRTHAFPDACCGLFFSGSLSVRYIKISPTLPQPVVVSASMPAEQASIKCHQTYALPSCARVRMLVREVVGLRDTLVGRVHQPC